MFDIGWTELLVIGVVALIVVGPKDLPGMFRTLGRFTGKMKGMAREFQRAMDDAADESGVKDVAKDLRNVTSPKSMGLDALNNAADRFEKWQPGQKPDAKVGTKLEQDPSAPAPASDNTATSDTSGETTSKPSAASTDTPTPKSDA